MVTQTKLNEVAKIRVEGSLFTPWCTLGVHYGVRLEYTTVHTLVCVPLYASVNAPVYVTVYVSVYVLVYTTVYNLVYAMVYSPVYYYNVYHTLNI